MILHSVEVNGLAGQLGNIMGSEEAVDLIVDYINTHKYFINEGVSREYSYTQAAFSWFENVFKPLMYAINTTLIRAAFPKKTTLELFEIISKQHYLATAGKEYVPYERVINDYIMENSKRFFIKILVKMS